MSGRDIMAVKKSAAKQSEGQRLLKFIKEWGGVATILIAVLYTFPFEAISRYLSWRDQDLLQARQVLAETSALYADAISTSEKLTDPRLKEFLLNTYNIRIYNKLSANKDAIDHASNQLLFSELYALGSFYVLSGFQEEGVGYYKLALNEAKKEEDRLTIYRELGNALWWQNKSE